MKNKDKKTQTISKDQSVQHETITEIKKINWITFSIIRKLTTSLFREKKNPNKEEHSNHSQHVFFRQQQIIKEDKVKSPFVNQTEHTHKKVYKSLIYTIPVLMLLGCSFPSQGISWLPQSSLSLILLFNLISKRLFSFLKKNFLSLFFFLFKINPNQIQSRKSNNVKSNKIR